MVTSPSFHSVIYHESDVEYPFHDHDIVSNCGGDGPEPPNEWLKYPPADEIEPETDNKKSRSKRQAWNPNWGGRKLPNLEKTTCVLGIEVDHFYYKHYDNREEVMAAVASHVRAISDIYRTTEFTLP